MACKHQLATYVPGNGTYYDYIYYMYMLFLQGFKDTITRFVTTPEKTSRIYTKHTHSYYNKIRTLGRVY